MVVINMIQSGKISPRVLEKQHYRVFTKSKNSLKIHTKVTKASSHMPFSMHVTTLQKLIKIRYGGKKKISKKTQLAVQHYIQYTCGLKKKII